MCARDGFRELNMSFLHGISYLVDEQMPHSSVALRVKHRPARLREPVANLHKSTDAPRSIGQVGAVRFGMSGRAVADRKKCSAD